MKEIDISIYTSSWFENATIDQLENEREKVRKDGFCNNSLDDGIRERCHKLLYIFDKWIRKRKYGDTKDLAEHLPRRTHGWYLPNDD